MTRNRNRAPGKDRQTKTNAERENSDEGREAMDQQIQIYDVPGNIMTEPTFQNFNLRNAIRKWLLSTMERKKWSAERWARQANISGTTITRFLNSSDESRTPSSRTLEKLAAAAGVPVMHEQQQVLIAIISVDKLIDEARRLHPTPLDIFSMPLEDYLPAIPQFAGCRAVKLKDGRFVMCKDVPPRPGQRVLVLHGEAVEEFWYQPPVLVSVEKAGVAPQTLIAGAPACDRPKPFQVLGVVAGEFQVFPDPEET